MELVEYSITKRYETRVQLQGLEINSIEFDVNDLYYTFFKFLYFKCDKPNLPFVMEEQF